MEDHDIEEERLLNTFGDHRTQLTQDGYHKAENNTSNNFNYNYKYKYVPTNYHHGQHQYHQQQYFYYRNNYPCRYNQHRIEQHEQTYEPLDWKTSPDNTTSSNIISDKAPNGSMEKEDFLDNFELSIEKDDQHPELEETDANMDGIYRNSNSRPSLPAPNSSKKSERNLSRSITYNEIELNPEGATVSKPSSKVKTREAKDSRDAEPTHRRSLSDDKSSGDLYRVQKPTKADILCGQSRVCANHPGNRYFQEVLERFAVTYDMATSKQQKMCMTKEIVARIHDSGGKFLKQKDGMWQEISIVAARDKVSHALRTKVASWKRNQKDANNPTVTPPTGPRRVSLSRNSLVKAKGLKRRISTSSLSSDIVPIPYESPISSESILESLRKSQLQEFRAMLNNTSSISSNSNSNERVKSTQHNVQHHPIQR